jgi:hypothetical protein
MNYEKILRFITGRDNTVPKGIKGCGHLTPNQSIDIYKQDYTTRLQATLASHYPAVATVLGDVEFSSLAQSYIEKTPSIHWDLGQYGDRLPEFLISPSTFPFIEVFPFLYDLALLEWEAHLFFHEAPLSTSITPLEPSEHILNNLTLNKGLRFFKSAFSIPSIYRAAIQNSEEIPTKWNKVSWYILTKDNFSVQLEELSEAEFAIISAWKEHGSLGPALQYLESSDQVNCELLSLEISPCLQRLHRSGLIEFRHCDTANPY